jgi:hypothetical protein
MACEWLKRNTRNRPVNRGHLDRLVRDLQSKRWVLTHQGIAFGIDGTLLDGQHRLTAIAEAGLPAMCVVWENVAEHAVLGMDQGKDRTGKDVVAIVDGEKLTVREAACINSMMKGMMLSPVTLTAQEQAASFREHAAAARFALALLPARKNGLKRAQVSAVIARAYYTVDHALLGRFCEALMSGLVKSEVDATVIVLRDFLLSAGAGTGSTTQAETYRKVARALDAYRKGDRLRTLYAAKTEPFPLPASGSDEGAATGVVVRRRAVAAAA